MVFEENDFGVRGVYKGHGQRQSRTQSQRKSVGMASKLKIVLCMVTWSQCHGDAGA